MRSITRNVRYSCYGVEYILHLIKYPEAGTLRMEHWGKMYKDGWRKVSGITICYEDLIQGYKFINE